MKQVIEISKTKIGDIFPGKSEKEIYEESEALRRERLKPWYTPFDNSMRIAKNEGIAVREYDCASSKIDGMFSGLLKTTKKTIVLGSGAIPTNVYCKDKVLSLMEKKMKDKEQKFTVIFGGLLMVENGENQFFDDILLPLAETKQVDIFYLPHRLAFHSCISDSLEVDFQEFHYEFKPVRHHYSLTGAQIGNYLTKYYSDLVRKHGALKVTKKNACFVRRQEKNLFFNLENILNSAAEDNLI